MIAVPDDPHSECSIIEDRSWGGEPGEDHGRPFCVVQHKAAELARIARHFEAEAERCARQGYPFNAWGAAVDAKTAWGAVAVHLLVWLLDECPADESWRHGRPNHHTEPTDAEIEEIEDYADL